MTPASAHPTGSEHSIFPERLFAAALAAPRLCSTPYGCEGKSGSTGMFRESMPSRLTGPLEFTLFVCVFGAIGFWLSTRIGYPQRFVRALAALLALPAAAWSISLVRQTIFELRTDGVVSPRMDGCAASLMPLLTFAVSLVIVFIAEVYAALGTLGYARRPPERFSFSNMTILTVPQLIASAIFATLGSWFGWAFWIDWRVDQVCL